MFFFSSRRRHTRFDCDWSSDVCSSDLDSGAVSQGVITREGTIAGLREPRASAVEESALGRRDHFLNSQLSWLDFNGRVLALAEDGTLPLLARVQIGRASCRERV